MCVIFLYALIRGQVYHDFLSGVQCKLSFSFTQSDYPFLSDGLISGMKFIFRCMSSSFLDMPAW